MSLVKYQKFSLTKASEMLMKSYNWGKECMQRYDELGLEGLKTLSKPGRPLLLSNKKFKRIVNQTRNYNGSVDPKKVMDNIKRRTGIKYHISNVRKKLHKLSIVRKAPKRVHTRSAFASVCRNWSFNTRRKIRTLEEQGFTVAAQDECIIKYDSISGAKFWIEKGIDYYVSSTGSCQKVVVFGLVTTDGQQMFSSFDRFDAKSFVEFLSMAHRRFGKICLIVDRAAQHKRSRLVWKYPSKHKDDVRLLFFPTSSPFLNIVEECEHHAKRTLVVSEYYHTFDLMRHEISEYFRTVRFKNLSVMNYVMRKAADCSYL